MKKRIFSTMLMFGLVLLVLGGLTSVLVRAQVVGAEEGGTTYSDVTLQAGISTTHIITGTPAGPPVGVGSAWADYDNDGDTDLFVTGNMGANHLYRNDGDTNADTIVDFTDEAATYGIEDVGEASHSAVFIDYDNDGDQDLYITKWGGNTLYKNRLVEDGIVSFEDVTATAGVADDGRAITSAWGDFDGDSYLDFYVAKHRKSPPGVGEEQWDHLYRNNGDGTFTDATDFLCGAGNSPCPATSGLGFTAGWADYDNDGDPDLYVVNDDINDLYHPNVMWRNDGSDGNGGWIFTDISVASGTNVSLNGMGLGVGDYDNDGWFDLAFSNIGPGVMLHNEQDGTWADVSVSAGMTETGSSWGTVFFDYDNNQLLDLLIIRGRVEEQTTPHPDRLLQNNGDGTFTDIAAAAGLDDDRKGRNASITDFNRDGFIDVFIGNYGDFPGLYQNDAATQGNTNHWLTIEAEGTNSNRDGIGTRFTLTTPNGVTQIREITSGPTHGGGDEKVAFFGMGSNVTGTLTVYWPNGLTEEIGEVAADQRLSLVEPPLSEFSDVIIDGDFDEWNNAVGNDVCVTDGGGMDDFSGIDDITEFCLASDQVSDLQVMMGWDNISVSGTSTACAIFDTDNPANGMIDYALCGDISGNPTSVLALSLYSCNDSDADGCGGAVLAESYGAFGFSTSEEGPFVNNDSKLEVALPFSDIGLTGGDEVAASFASYLSLATLDAPRDPIFAGSNWLTFGLGNGEASLQTTPYVDVAGEAGLVLAHDFGDICSHPDPLGGHPPIGSGSAWGDFDGDGDTDLYVTNMGGANHLYRNDGDTTFDGITDFTDVAGTYGITLSSTASTAANFIDYDNDGDQDLFVGGHGGNTLYKNRLVEDGIVSFEDVSASSGLVDNGRVITASWADFDQDGYLDVYLAKHRYCNDPEPPHNDTLYHANGDGTFTNVTEYLCGAGVFTCAQTDGLGFMAGWVDYDNDSDLDLYLVNDNIGQAYYSNVLWRNDGPGGAGWVFTDVSIESGANVTVNGMGLGVGDYNNDGWFDLAFSNSGEARVLRSDGDGTFTSVNKTIGVITHHPTWGTAFIDFNNNGHLDLFVSAGDVGGSEPYNDYLFDNIGNGDFADISFASGLDDDGRARSASIADYNRDGFVDVFVGNYAEAPGLYQNYSADQGNTNHWLTVEVTGTVSNRDGIGTRLWLATADGVIQQRQITSGPTHGGGDEKVAFFGMGDHITGTLTVSWPSGAVQDLGVVSADQWLGLTEPVVSGGGDIIIDGSFNDWDNGIGNEACIIDQGGKDDVAGNFDITRYCMATNEVDTAYFMMGFDENGLPNNVTSTACSLVDTNNNLKADTALCAVIVGTVLDVPTTIQSVDRYSCDDTMADGCGSATFQSTYFDHGIHNTITGPFGNNDAFVEFSIPIADLGVTNTDEVNSTMMSFVDTSSLTDAQDSIFSNSNWLIYNLGTGESSFTAVFSDETVAAGITHTHTIGDCAAPMGSGSAWADYDGDGDSDLFVTNRGGADLLYRNEGDTNLDGVTDFEDVAASLGVDAPTENSLGAVFIDYDNDGDQDLFVTMWDGNTLYKNRLVEDGIVSFEDVSVASGLVDTGRAITASWGDFDGDGDLDVYLSKHRNCGPPDDNPHDDTLYQNNGNGTFTNVTDYLCGPGVFTCAQTNGLGFTAGWADYDNDGDPDLYLVNDNIDASHYHNVMWRNDGPDGNGGWLFTDISAESGTDISLNGMGLGVGDYDNDGWLDLAFSNTGPGKVMQNNQDGTFSDVSASVGVTTTTVTWGTVFFDYDNDQNADLYFVSGAISEQTEPYGNFLFHNQGDGTFVDATLGSGVEDPRRGRNASITDYDRDGFVDLFVANLVDAPGLYHNELGDQGSTEHWLTVEVTGTVSNRDGIGTRLILSTPDNVTQIREITSGPTHGGGDEKVAFFGLGQNVTGTLTVRWPTGYVQEIGEVNADQWLGLTEPNVQLSDIVINGLFSDWSNRAGLNKCIMDTGGKDDVGSMSDITQFCLGSDQINTIQVMMSFDDVDMTGTSTACTLFDTDAPANGMVDYALCATIEGSSPTAMQDLSLFSCDDTDADGCGGATLDQSYTAYGFSNTSTGAFGDPDSKVEFAFSPADIGLLGSDTATVSFASYPNTTALGTPHDTIFETPNWMHYDLGTGERSMETTFYSDVTLAAGLDVQHELAPLCDHPDLNGGRPPITTGSAWGDYDNDGDSDLYITNMGGADSLYRNDGDTDFDEITNFTNVAATYGLDDPANISLSAVFIDYDNDGDQDLFVTMWNGNMLFQNRLVEDGNVAFVDVTPTAGLADYGRAITSAWGDYDQDGDLDVYLAKHFECPPPNENSEDHLYRNNGDGTFTDVTEYLCGPGNPSCAQTEGLGFTAGWSDLDNDGDQDLYLVNDNIDSNFYHNVLWRNDGSDGLGGWLFTDISAASGTDASVNGMGLGVGDYDNDGWFDLAFSNLTPPGRVLHNNQNGTWTDVSATVGMADTTATWATAFFDYDNSGLLDLFMVSGKVADADPNFITELYPDLLLENNGDGSFTNISILTGFDNDGRGRNASLADFDRDGLLDMFIYNYGQEGSLYHNEIDELGNTNHWLTVQVQGTVSNRDGIGTRMWLTTGDAVTQMREISSGPTLSGGDERAAYFGLGSHTTGTLTVRWPNGVIQEIGEVSADQWLLLVEPEDVGVVSDVDIDGDFSEWDNGIGNDACVTDMGGINDYDAIPDLTRLCVGSDQVNDLYLLMAIDNTTGNTSTTGCALFDTDAIPNGNIDYAVCGEFDGSTFAEGPVNLASLALYSCDDGSSAGCTGATWVQDLTNYGFDNAQNGPFGDPDSQVETTITFADLGLTSGDTVLASFATFDNIGTLSVVRDSVFVGSQRLEFGLGNGESEITTLSGGMLPDVVYMTARSDGSVNGLAYGNEDVLGYDRAAKTWYTVFDGSDLGMDSANVDAFTFLDDGSMLFSVEVATTLPDVGAIDDSDVIQFTPLSYGRETSGTLSLYLQGSLVGLTTNGEDIDAIAISPEGDLLLSTGGLAKVNGASLEAQDEDILAYDSGTNLWSMYFDGSDVGLDDPLEDVWSVWVDPSTNEIYLSTVGDFSVPGSSGSESDVFVCQPTMLGETTQCTYDGLYLDGSAEGLDIGLNGISVVPGHAKAASIYTSNAGNDFLSGTSILDEDVAGYDAHTGVWYMVFDGSDVGISGTAEVDAFTFLNDGSMLLSVQTAMVLPDVGAVTPNDVIQFTPSTYGDVTAGTFSMYLQGSTVFLTSPSENLDGLAISPEGDLILSTSGNAAVNGKALKAKDEDMLAYDFGSGLFHMYFKGTELETDSEDVRGIYVNGGTGYVYLTTLGSFTVTGASGDGRAILWCSPSNGNPVTTCNYQIFEDVATFGLSGSLDGVFLRH